MASMKDRLRGIVLGQSQFYKKQFTLPGGEIIVLRQPTIGDRQRIIENSTKDGIVNIARFRMSAVIECARDPRTGEKVFDVADMAAFMEAPAGSVLDKMADAIMEIMGGSEAAKN